MHKNNRLKTNQRGVVSLTITVVVMVVVTLIVSSFALVVRREQRRSLDRQLSAQAFYAAEVGVQDAISSMIKTPNVPNPIDTPINTCDGAGSFIDETTARGLTYDPVISQNVEYTCVLIDPTPTDIPVSSAGPDDGSFVIPLNSSGPNIGNIDISWQEKNGETNFAPSYPQLPSAGLNAPMLRITVLPGFGGGSLDKNTVNAGMHTMFLYPDADGEGNSGQIQYLGGNASTWGPTNDLQGSIVRGHCNASNTPLHCNVRITDLDDALIGWNKTQYFVHIQPLYKQASLQITALEGNGVDKIPIANSRATVDVTGRAADVLRRVQVSVPIADGVYTRGIDGLIPPGALATTDEICKRWELAGSTATSDCAGATPIDTGAPTGGGDGDATIGQCTDLTDPLCQNSNGDPNAPPFRWSNTFTNLSNNNPSTVQDCTWDWGDGTSNTYPASHPACTFNGKIVHDYNPPVDSRGWEALINSTTGASGCWKFTVRLTMRFTPASGLGNDVDIYVKYLPGGKANDPPNPTTPTGICYNKFQDYIP